MRTVTIQSGKLGRFDDGAPFLVESGALDLKFILPQMVGDYYLTISNAFDGGQNERTRPIPKTGEVSLEELLPGELRLTVKHYVHGEFVAQHKIEPLILKAVDGSVLATPELTLLEQRISALERAEAARQKAMQTVTQEQANIIKDLHALLVKFVAYAWAEYQTDFQLNAHNLDMEAFLAAMGIDSESLTKEDLDTIKHAKEAL